MNFDGKMIYQNTFNMSGVDKMLEYWPIKKSKNKGDQKLRLKELSWTHMGCHVSVFVQTAPDYTEMNYRDQNSIISVVFLRFSTLF